jgi:cell division protein FtsW
MPHRVLRHAIHAPDYPLAGLIVLLLLIGIVMVSSASVVLSYTNYGNNNYFLNHQILAAGLGIGVLLVTQAVDYHKYRSIAPVALFLTIGLLAAVVLTPFGTNHGTTARRWIQMGPLSFQPTEMVKLTFIIYLAAWLERKGDQIKNFSYGFLPFAVMMGVVALLIMKQPDLGTLSVIVLTSAAMFFVSGASLSHLGLGVGSALVALFILIKAAPYRLARLTIFLHPNTDTSGIGYHVNQALLAIGSGGLFGLGFGHSIQKYNYLPEASTDSIFAVIAEELGMVRASMLLGLFALLAWRGFKIARGAPDQFGMLVAVGITSWIVFQTVINIAAMLSLVPLTGVPLPLISYGGSSLIWTLGALGILLNISKQTKETGYETTALRRRVGGTRPTGVGRS